MSETPESQELVVHGVQPAHLRCRPLGGGPMFTVHPRGIILHVDVVPGEILRMTDTLLLGGHRARILVGRIAEVRLDAKALGLVPLKLEDLGMWSPAEEYWGEPGERIEPCLLPIISAGPRPSFEMEQVVPGMDYSNNQDIDPIADAADWTDRGKRAKARAILTKCLMADLRCLDAHAHLGNLLFDVDPPMALRHYRVGVAIGDLVVPPESNAVLPWGCLDNRPFLRCLHGMATVLWRLGQHAAAAEVMERALWLNPADNQGHRFMIDQVRRGVPWSKDLDW